MKETELTPIRDRLQQRLAQLAERAEKIESDLRKPQNPDWEERATEIENDEVLKTSDSTTLEEVKQIQSALDRVNAGAYGVCLSYGRSVGDKRLQAVPHAATCINCASA